MSLHIAQVLAASTGGIGRHVSSISARLVAAGHRVSLYCPESTAQAHGFDLDLIDWLPLNQVARARTADIVHAHGTRAGLLAATTVRLGGPPLAISWHNSAPQPVGRANFLRSKAETVAAQSAQRLLARTATVTLGASSDLVDEAVRLGARWATLLPVAAPTLPAPSATRAELRRRLGLADDELMILTVGRLAPQKNLGQVLDTAARLKSRTDLRFMIAGVGPGRTDLETRITADRLPVTLLGHKDQVADLLAVADAALLTSVWEARALFAQEALMAGVPLISTRVGGIEELVGSAAELVPLDDAEATAAALIRVLDDPVRGAALRAAGRAQAADWPDEKAVVNQLIEIYHQLEENSSASR